MSSVADVASPAPSKGRVIAYWVTTLLVAQEMVAASLWAFLRPGYVSGNLTHLGYPPYVQTIIGVWAFPCAVTLIAPRFGRLKEWAYAGAFFDYSGAVASHACAGDGPGRWVAPLVFAVVALASWALRPNERRGAPTAPVEPSRRPWVVAVVVIVGLIAVALLTLPGKDERQATLAPSIVETGQVELPNASGVREDIDLHDLPSRDGKT
jgi:hypothetical protein